MNTENQFSKIIYLTNPVQYIEKFTIFVIRIINLIVNHSGSQNRIVYDLNSI